MPLNICKFWIWSQVLSQKNETEKTGCYKRAKIQSRLQNPPRISSRHTKPEHQKWTKIYSLPKRYQTLNSTNSCLIANRKHYTLSYLSKVTLYPLINWLFIFAILNIVPRAQMISLVKQWRLITSISKPCLQLCWGKKQTVHHFSTILCLLCIAVLICLQSLWFSICRVHAFGLEQLAWIIAAVRSKSLVPSLITLMASVHCINHHLCLNSSRFIVLQMHNCFDDRCTL